MNDDEFNEDLDKLIQSARHLMEMCRQEEILDKIDGCIGISSLTDAQAVIDNIKHNIDKNK